MKVTFIRPSGERQTVEGHLGQSVMEVAKRGGIEEIIGECSGCLACATCHVFVDPAWTDAVGTPSPDESDMLGFARGRRETSRLSCQIRLKQGLDGLVVTAPERQG